VVLKIFHTADVHLGLKFASYPEQQEALAEARFGTLERMVRRASEEKCQLFVVGGDLFDRVSVPKRDVVRAAEILSRFDGALVAVLPGNHDYFEASREDSIWAQFREAAGDRVIVLSEPRTHDLSEWDLEGVCLYPAPCHDKHSAANGVGWIKAAVKDPRFRHHIGVAHGSLEGLSYDREGKYYPMTRQELVDAGMDFWLMGHIHVRHPETSEPSARILYPGTPEPDGFDCGHEGTAWIIETEGRGAHRLVPLSTGRFRFEHASLELSTLADLDSLRSRFSSEEIGKSTLLKLELKGRLDRDAYAALGQSLRDLEGRLLKLKTYTSELRVKVTEQDIDREFTRDSFPHKLLLELARNSEDPEALQIAYDLIRESGPAKEIAE
jgi:exonuclease SbcD